MHAVKTYDVIIIGAGPAGIFTALELADKGFKILMVEKGQDIRERIATSLNKKACPKTGCAMSSVAGVVPVPSVTEN